MQPSFCAIAETALQECCPDNITSEQEQLVDPLSLINCNSCLCWVLKADVIDPNGKTFTDCGAYPGEVACGALSSFDCEVPINYSRVSVLLASGNINNAPYPVAAVMQNGYSFAAQAFSGSEPFSSVGSTASGSSAGAGAINLLNPCGELDELVNYCWEGQPVEILVAKECCDYNNLVSVFKGTAQGLTWSNKQITINLKDRKFALDKPIQLNTYAGNGGLSGGSALISTPKPLLFGVVNNITPVLVDAANLVYQVHDGAVTSIDELRDGGVPLTFAGDYSNIYAVTPPLGGYITSLQNGLVRLGGVAFFGVTLNARNSENAANTSAEIIRQIVTTRLGANNMAESQLDLASFASLNVSFAYKIGLYIDKQTSIKQVLDQIMAATHGWWNFNRQGQISLGNIGQNILPQTTITQDDILTIKRLTTRSNISKRTVAYNKNYTVQKNNDLAASVSSINRELYGQEFSNVVDYAPEVLSPNEVVTASLLVNKSDAINFAQTLRNIYRTKRDIYEIEVACGLFKYWLGDRVELKVNRFNLHNGKPFTVVAINENARKKTAVLKLIG